MTDELLTSTETASEIFGSNRMWGLKEQADPDPISYLPQTIGWAGVLIVILCILSWQLWKFYCQWRRNDYRRDAIYRLRQMLNGNESYRQLPEILRIVALTSFPREDVAELRSEMYLQWLNDQLMQPVFLSAEISLLNQIPYLPETQLPKRNDGIDGLIEKCILWVDKHHVSI